MAGSSRLTAEQQEWYRHNLHARYVMVQEQPQIASRRERRGRRFRPNREQR